MMLSGDNWALKCVHLIAQRQAIRDESVEGQGERGARFLAVAIEYANGRSGPWLLDEADLAVVRTLLRS